ncbi:hypothetical protein AAG570_010887, partial [Ranatra chinensis]
ISGKWSQYFNKRPSGRYFHQVDQFSVLPVRVQTEDDRGGFGLRGGAHRLLDEGQERHPQGRHRREGLPSERQRTPEDRRVGSHVSSLQVQPHGEHLDLTSRMATFRRVQKANDSGADGVGLLAALQREEDVRHEYERRPDGSHQRHEVPQHRLGRPRPQVPVLCGATAGQPPVGTRSSQTVDQNVYSQRHALRRHFLPHIRHAQRVRSMQSTRQEEKIQHTGHNNFVYLPIYKIISRLLVDDSGHRYLALPGGQRSDLGQAGRRCKRQLPDDMVVQHSLFEQLP